MTAKVTLQQYVLGTVDEEARAELEQKYFADDEVFEELLDVEHDLVDAYVHGTLASAERKQFEKRFLTTAEGRERVEFARLLKAKGESRKAKVFPFALRLSPFAFGLSPLALGTAASFALVGFLAAWLIFAPRQRDNRPQVASRPSAVQPAPKTDVAPASAGDSPAKAGATSLITLVLTPGGTRGGEAAPPLVLRTAPQWVQLDLVLEQDRYDSYNAELQDVEGGVLWSASSLRSDQGSVKPKVPAKLLPPGDYVVVLYGVRAGAPVEVSNYTFTVTALSRKK